MYVDLITLYLLSGNYRDKASKVSSVLLLPFLLLLCKYQYPVGQLIDSFIMYCDPRFRITVDTVKIR